MKELEKKKPKLSDFKREINDGQDYADWYKEYYQALEKYIVKLEQSNSVESDVIKTPQEIKDELIKMGWSDTDIHVIKEYNKVNFVYHKFRGRLVVYKDGNAVLRLLEPTLDRIKALIFALTGETL